MNLVITPPAVLSLQAIEEDGTQNNSHVVGTYLLSKMLMLRDEFEVVGDVRGKGLMLGLELVTDKVVSVTLNMSVCPSTFTVCCIVISMHDSLFQM